MCNFGAIFGGQSKSLKRLLGTQQALAQQADERAAQAALDAQEQAKAAAVLPADSESARQASEARMRKLLAAQGPTAAAGSPNVGYKVLFGQ